LIGGPSSLRCTAAAATAQRNFASIELTVTVFIMRCKAAVIFSLVAATASVYAAEKPCTVHDNEKGKFFDLTALKSR
jgi:hypothetical protein